MNATFYLSAAIAVLSTVLVITRANGVHALLYLVVSLLAVALVFFTLGAPFAAALEVIVYAGAIMVLFVFVVMMMNLGDAAAVREARWMEPKIWVGPSILAILLTAQLAYMLDSNTMSQPHHAIVPARAVGIAMYGPYLLCVELASMLLLAALVGAYRLAHTEHGRL
ncbi:NADH-quinone oxidoreductase subunit J [Acidiphilium sp. AL]|uniref:NADH-quinone oxidoreductase subunit J n=1 Tax=Acidiphilium iwatense TaxID=768198 RepID=A0ABS9DYI3_9PROT|nr:MULTISPECIES: NADH-quinone oxidoreductase subunit J [Acidiphilium]MCF3947148.1 NADH-quinone oxidoreductase subunit J [Acidiphilium iwatense]MCU4160631.1 NADH-quinone oxidoreductase subunit J [Acidiphilium sp. AL]